MTFQAQQYSRTHCTCGAARVAHEYGTGRCPEAYRPDVLSDARAALREAEASGDQARIFVARGNVQRLGGRTP